MRYSRPNRQRAIVLIVTIAVLTILALLASIFATTSKMERTISRNNVDMVRAKMLAVSGVDKAVIELRNLLLSNAFNTNLSWRYWGEDQNMDNALSGAEDLNRNGRIDQNSCLLRNALRPSFSILTNPMNPASPPKLIPVYNDQYGVMENRAMSGELAATYAGGSDTYVVRVVDTASQLFLNGPVQDPLGNQQQQTLLTQNAVLMLNTLGAEVGVPNFGARIQQMKTSLLRPFATKGELKTLGMPGALTQAEYDLVKDYVTINTWVDLGTIRPNPQPLNAGYFPGPQNQYRAFPWNLRYGMEPRAPVNMNAAERPVLVSVLNGLNANICEEFAWNYQVSGGGGTKDAYRVRRPSPGPITLTQARNIADQIIQERARRGFDSWDDLFSWIDGANTNRPGRRLNGVSPDQGAIIKANANPNTLFNKFNPNALVWKQVDKSDLAPNFSGGIAGYTTEFCFTPMGVFEITSMGRIVGNNQVVATHEVLTLVQVFDVARHTTERDFTGASQTAPTMRVLYLPEHMPDQWDSRATNRPASDFDGQLCLAPKWIRPPGCVAAANMTWAAQYQISMDDNPSSLIPSPYASSPRPEEDRSVFDSNGQAYSNVSAAARDESDLFPDGVYQGADRYRHLEYDEWLRPIQTGSMDMWIKNNADTRSPYVRTFHHSIDSFRDGTLQYTATYTWAGQFGAGLSFYLLFLAGMTPYPGCQYRGGPQQPGPNNLVNNYKYTTLNIDWPVHTWHHVAVTWTGMNQATECFIDGQRCNFSGQTWTGISYMYLALWYGNYLQIGNFFAEMPINDGLGNNKVDFFAGGTMDDVSLYDYAMSSVTPPDKYPVTNGTSGSYQFVGRFQRATSATNRIPQKQFPFNQPVTIASIAYTDYRRYAEQPPTTAIVDTGRCIVSWKRSGEALSTFDSRILPGSGAAVRPDPNAQVTLAPNETLDYRVRFDNSRASRTGGNFLQGSVTPYFDEITVTFTTSPKFLFWSTNYD